MKIFRKSFQLDMKENSNFMNILPFISFKAGILSLLDEPMSELKIFALRKLDGIVNEFWPEISEAIEKM